jgi:serine/threonine protein kinase
MSKILTETLLEFELREIIGGGGEGNVYKAYDPQLDCIFAIKAVPINYFKDTKEYFSESRKLFLSKHHNIVPVNYACRDNDFIYLSMPFYPNGSIKALTDKRFLTTREIIRYSLQFLSGLNNIHSKELIHFDIKTENILISDSDKAMISDFGLAQYTSHYGFAKNHGTTPVFAPPELFSQAEHNIKFDIYQSGIAMYRMCIGDTYFESQIQSALFPKGTEDMNNFVKHLERGTFPSRKAYPAHIPKQLLKIINKCLNPNPDDRYSSVISILNDLSKIDSVNDWQYNIVNVNNLEWTKDGYVVNCYLSNNNNVIEALKNGRHNRTFCKKFDNTKDLFALNYDCLNEEW